MKKKLLAVLLAVSLIASMCTTAFATDAGTVEGSAISVMDTFAAILDTELVDLPAKYAEIYEVVYTGAMMDGKMDAAIYGLEIAVDSMDVAYDFVDGYELPAELDGVKKEMLNELVNTKETLQAVVDLLKNDKVADTDSLVAEVLGLEGELHKHLKTLSALGYDVGIEIDPYLVKLNDAVVDYAKLVDTTVVDTYNLIVDTVDGFVEAYAEWVEDMGAAADKLHPELGAPVRKFLTETPADALAILAVYGEDAIFELFDVAVDAAGDIADVALKLADVMAKHGVTIYNAVLDNAKVEALVEGIMAKLVKAQELVKETTSGELAGAILADKEAALQAVYDELTRMYEELYDVAISAVDSVDEEAAQALRDALDALNDVLCITCDAADGYLGWLADHTEAMGAALLTALLDNAYEFATVAGPAIDELIWALLAEIDKAIIEFLPVADQWMYDWLYNNPEKVIAFFTEYAEEIEWLMEEFGDEALCVLGYIAYTYGPEVLDYVINNPEEALDQFVNWYNKYGYRVWPMIDVYLEELGIYDMIENDAKATLEKIEKALKALGIEIQGKIQNKIDEIYAMIEGEIEATKAEIEKAIDELIAMIEEMLYDATHAEYTVTTGSYYVAIDKMYGDGEGYADKLAAALGVAYTEIGELDATEIAKADLITVRYNNEPMIGAMIEDAKDYKKVEAKDWSGYVGEEGVEYVQQALAEVEAMLAEQGMGELADMAAVAVASYAYEYVGHLIGYIEDLETIAAINPDALVISVGMNNALADVVLALGEDEIALGEYIQYVVDAANLEAFAYVLTTGNAIYVDAPAVETEFDAAESTDAVDFILTLIDEESREVLLATDAGHEYIKEQILGALTVAADVDGLLGDANGDGVVDYIDAIFVLEYDAKLRTANELALALCDVDGSGDVDYVDAIIILEYDAKIISKFPVAA